MILSSGPNSYYQGFDSRVFTRAHRLLPEKAVKILCPMPHFNASSETAQLESYLGDVQYHQQYVWNELGGMLDTQTRIFCWF